MNKDVNRLSLECTKCITNKYLNRDLFNNPKDEQLAYFKDICQVVADAPKTSSGPEIATSMAEILERRFGIVDDYTDIKKHFNELILNNETIIKKRINEADDPLMMAIKLALVGNYIDFGVFKDIDETVLDELVKEANKHQISDEDYLKFKNDLNSSKSLLYITDNCGEIVFDKFLIEKILELYPNLIITAMVRGANVVNDASMDDAKQVGLDKLVKVVDNGTKYIGTVLEKLPEDRISLLENSDMIISKGQANNETMIGCGLNVYYLLLCKCDYFASKYGVKVLTGVLKKEA